MSKHKPMIPRILWSLWVAVGLTACTLGGNAVGTGDSLKKFNHLADSKGAKWNVNPNLIRAIISVESAGRINAVSPKGAVGLMQVMPATAERMGIPRNALSNPERNMEAGVRYLSYLNKLFNRDPLLVAAAYNAGEGAVQKYSGIPPFGETQYYAPAVVERLKLLERCGIRCYTHKHMRKPSRYLKSM